jgi:hypothetical protein
VSVGFSYVRKAGLARVELSTHHGDQITCKHIFMCRGWGLGSLLHCSPSTGSGLRCGGGAGGTGGVGAKARPSLFRSRQTTVLPLFTMVPVPLLAPLARGHQCLFTDLQDVNLCPHHSHFHCGRPLAASTATFWCSCLNVQFLFHASCFFSFWA